MVNPCLTQNCHKCIIYFEELISEEKENQIAYKNYNHSLFKLEETIGATLVNV